MYGKEKETAGKGAYLVSVSMGTGIALFLHELGRESQHLSCQAKRVVNVFKKMKRARIHSMREIHEKPYQSPNYLAH